jgi:hypothetical protein
MLQSRAFMSVVSVLIAAAIAAAGVWVGRGTGGRIPSWGRHSEIGASAANVRISTYATITMIEIGNDTMIYIDNPAIATLPSGSKVCLSNGTQLALGDSVEVGGVKYKGSESQVVQLFIKEDGSALEGAVATGAVD